MKFMMGLWAAIALASVSAPAMAWPCRVTDFTERSLSSLNEVERLSFVTEMTQTEYDRIKAAAPDSANYYALVADSANIREARKTAQAKLESLGIDNIDGLRLVWTADYLDDDQLRGFTDCITARQPGLVALGRPGEGSAFHMTISHLTPIGIEKIATKLVASYNVANAAELEAFLDGIGPQDNYTARTIALKIADPAKRAVVVMRAGWESPLFLFIPPYPLKAYFAED